MAKPRIVRLVIAPARVELASGASAQWTVSAVWSTGQTKPVTVVWRATGGTITSSGRYTAGATDGVYTVTATQVGGSLVATAEVLVKKYVIRNAAYGPQATMTCPGGAVAIAPGAGTIQAATAAEVAGTTFCLGAGTYSITGAITPKSGNVYVGAYGAIIDGSGWTSGDTTQAAFRTSGADIDNVTLRNLVIQNMPQKGIYANAPNASGWTVEYCEVTGIDVSTAVLVGNTALVRNCHIHHNATGAYSAGGGYGAYQATGAVFEYNDLSYNGNESKLVQSTDCIFRHNWVHHNINGIWYDYSNSGGLIHDNLIEDNADIGIFYEISDTGTIYNNKIYRNGDNAIAIVVSWGCDIYGNDILDNHRGIQYRVKQASLVDGQDLRDNSTHNNSITVPSAARSAALGFSGQSFGNSFATEPAPDGVWDLPYTTNTKNNDFEDNDYFVASLTSPKYWYWNALKSWAEWQALGYDATGSASVV